MGKLWFIDYCILHYNQRMEQQAYKVYVTDRLKAINDSVAHTFGGSAPKMRYYDILDLMKPKDEKEPEKTAEQVISSISDKLERLGNGPI